MTEQPPENAAVNTVELVPGIYLMKIPLPKDEPSPGFVNAYLIRGDKGFTLVDTGWNTDESMGALQRGLREIEADIGQISQIIVTHIHPDHYGMAGRIKQLSGAKLLMHDIEKGFIASRYIDMDDLLYKTGQLLVANGVPGDVAARLRDATVVLQPLIAPALPDATLHHGETISTGRHFFNVLWTPGHSSGHICLYAPEEKILISGDHILPGITPNVSVNPQSIENPLGHYLKSLEEIKKLDVRLTLPGHETPFAGLKRRIESIIRHHQARNQEILGVINGRQATAFQIAMKISWSNRRGWEGLPDFHKRMAVFETLAHLEMMHASGQVGRRPRKDVVYYFKN